ACTDLLVPSVLSSPDAVTWTQRTTTPSPLFGIGRVAGRTLLLGYEGAIYSPYRGVHFPGRDARTRRRRRYGELRSEAGTASVRRMRGRDRALRRRGAGARGVWFHRRDRVRSCRVRREQSTTGRRRSRRSRARLRSR